MPSKLKKAIGAVKDQTSISLAKVTIYTSPNLEVAVLKATTHDDDPIDERYANEVIRLVSSDKAYAKACARAIGKRIGRTRNWIVALKSLMLVLRIFQDGDPYFPREVLHAMKKGAKILNLSSFRDDSNSSPWDFTAFVRTFALYLDERLDCFLTGKLQRRYTQGAGSQSSSLRGSLLGKKQKELVRDVKPTMLLDKITCWQRLLERAIATRPTGVAKTNRLVQISLYAVVQESFDLYKDISDGLALLLDSFFHLPYQSCVTAFQTCVKASKLYEELREFYSVCKENGVGRAFEYPTVQSVSEELMDTLQEFLKDQSSFPTNQAKSQNRVLMLPAPPNAIERSVRNFSYGGQSESSMATTTTATGYYSGRTSDRGSGNISSEFGGSQSTSLEDLISATESRRTPSISIDLEAYSDQFEKKLQKDDTFVLSETGSTHSLPVSNSMADLVSLDDWPEVEVQGHEREQHPKQQNQQKLEKGQNSSNNWELVLAEAITTPPTTNSGFDSFATQDNQQTPGAITTTPTNNGFDPFAFQPHQRSPEAGIDDISKTGWEIVLVETATKSTQQPTFNASSLDSLYNQPQQPLALPPPEHYNYNPFLQDTVDLPVAPTTPLAAEPPTFNALVPAQDAFAVSSPPTFQATPTFSAQSLYTFQSSPTFSAQSPNTYQATPTFSALSPHRFQATPTFSAQSPIGSMGFENENDTFSAFSRSSLASDQKCNGSMNQQQNLIQEQQLWLQNQNKIIAKHIA